MTVTDREQETPGNVLKPLFETSSGEKVCRNEDTIVVYLPKNRNCLTTSFVNGGYHEDLEAIFNHQPKNSEGCRSHSRDMEGGSIEAYIAIHAKRLGLDPEKTAGMTTAARMKNAAIATRTFRTFEVTAIVTAGIEVNGGRAGDPASWHEEDGKTVYVGGTINTIIIVNSHMRANALTRAVMTAAEAKVVAIQQLMAPSKCSTGIATGSGTDQITIISSMDSPHILTWPGKHSKAGELIALCVIEATTKALELQTGLSPESQRDMLVRLSRFNIEEKHYWDAATSLEGEHKREPFIEALRVFAKNPAVVAMTASILHICDEVSWGLVPELAGKRSALAMMRALPEMSGTPGQPHWEVILDERQSILDNWVRLSAWCVKHSCGGSP
ncbi:adenosylcobinamide amidohydrolase [Methanoregula sp.]|uniref:adenosylcobinamide amidohydrolase n=1 Tax=Methanoregula sp. TaxID=2052170 RepID=UPI0026385D0B|nr:adenosylcobinamide amidohydrolase [Methanoregula sp.]MDD5144197.1 adenosylcobinamide amidohydrolase [Methanoregula sp.]